MKPQYLYRCMNGHETSQNHGMLESPIIVCQKCGCRMHKVPQRVSVVWNGNPPGKGGLHPLVKQYNKDYPEMVDKFKERKA